MINPEVILDRFGDEEFLCTLWQKAKLQLPGEIESIGALLEDNSKGDSLAKKMHKLRGLISNFLDGGKAIARLKECEELARKDNLVELPKAWRGFIKELSLESTQLEDWLKERGFLIRSVESTKLDPPNR